jgi:hypothetical protein
MGCLSAPFKLLLLVLLAAAVAGAWFYRDQLADYARTRLGGRSRSLVAASGVPGAHALAGARAKLATLSRGRTDSVTLDADEMASLVQQSLDADVRAQLDSLHVLLSEGRLGFTGWLRTARLPRELLGPFAMAVRQSEPIAAEGPLRVTRPGAAEWALDRLKLRDFPLPREAIPRLIARAFGDSTRHTLLLVLPTRVSDIHVRVRGVTLLAGGLR